MPPIYRLMYYRPALFASIVSVVAIALTWILAGVLP